MTQPARRSQREEIKLYLKRQAWVLFILIIVAWIIDVIALQGELVVAKSMAIGGLLSFITQALFASFVFWRSGSRVRSIDMVSQMYRGQVIKWMVTVFGFAFIFINIKPLSAPALFLGYIVMKITHMVMLSRIK